MEEQKKHGKKHDEDTKAMMHLAKKQKEEHLNAEEAEKLYGDEQPYERIRLENEVRFYRDQMGSSLIEIGKRLLRMKAQEGHGGFLHILENVGMAERSAQYAIRAAQRFSNTKSISYLGSTKLIVLSVLEDDDIQTLEEGGRVAGVNLDEIEYMSTRELKTALRKEKDERKKDRDALEATIAVKNETLNAMELKAIHRPPSTKVQVAQAELDEYRPTLFSAILSGVSDIKKAQDIFDRCCRAEGVNVDQLLALVRSLSNELLSLKNSVDEFGYLIDNPYPIKEKLPCIHNLP